MSRITTHEASAPAAVEFCSVSKALRGVQVLDDLTLEIPAGSCHALVGLNGAGKTTALRVMLGMLHPDRGHVRINGQDVTDDARDVWRGVGHLIEAPFSYPELTARENATFAARLHGAGVAYIDADIESLADVLRLTKWLDMPVRRLSLGTRQKVGIIAAFVHRPCVIVLDEPTNGLDPLAVVGLRTLISEFVRGGGSVLVTSHHFDELARIADRVDVLHHGRIIESFAPEGTDLEQRFFSSVLAVDSELEKEGLG